MNKRFYFDDVLINIFKLLNHLEHDVPNEFIEPIKDIRDDVIKLEAIIFAFYDLIKDKD